jgi:mRNA interferase RelE/StbE
LVWRIELTASAVEQLSRLDKIEARRVTLFLRQRLATLDDPRATGKALNGPQLGICGATAWATTESSVTSRTTPYAFS